MTQKIFTFAASFAFFLALCVTRASAWTAPLFPSCVSPVGTLVVSYDSGIHGIAGQSGEFSGRDSVYQTSDVAYLQCFCPNSGSGIQTNWWKITGMSQDEINTYQKLGWIFVTTGKVWGLTDDPYMAQNQNYSCLPTTPAPTPTFAPPGPGGTPVCDSAVPAAPQLVSVTRNGSSATLTWTKVDMATTYAIFYGVAPGQYIYGVPSTGNVTTYTINSLDLEKNYYFSVVAVNNCMPSASSGSNSTGSVLGASTGKGGQVLGLADTGTTVELVVALSVLVAAASLYFVSLRKVRV